MHGVGPGAVFGGRYALRRRLSHSRELECWSAHDTTLQREVALTIVGSGHPNCAGVLDAARRAAGVEDTRLVRILDVGKEKDSSFIVEEAMNGSESLATILLQGPLLAEEARRVAGETAKALETAGQRGLHHLRLTPHHVLIDPDGAIRVSGVAVAAAIDRPDEREPDSSTALRRDAVSLVAIVYAALTGRWPLEGKVPGVEPAPTMAGGVASPSEIVAGVPDDLETLCRTTLNEAAGPLTPGVVASRIAPWSHESVRRPEVDPTVVLPLPTVDDLAGSLPSGDDLAGNLAASPVEMPEAAVSPTSALTEEPVERPAEASPRANTPVAAATATGEVAPAGSATSRAFGAALAGAGAAAGAVSGKLGSLGRTAGQTSAPAAPGPAPRPEDVRMMSTRVLGEIEGIEPPLPMLPASTAMPPSRGQSKLVMLIMAAFVALALVVGYQGLVRPSSSASPSKPTPRRTVVVTAPPVVVPASPAPQAATTGAGPIAILSATGFDPEGDQKENNDQAARVFDGDITTSWSSERYQTKQFGNLKKGVGVVLDLGQPTSVHEVTIDLGSGPVDVTVYAATGASRDGATVIGDATDASGKVQIKAASPLKETQYVIVWFTKLVKDGSQYRASISEIALS